ncbi:START domain-containing protein [Pontibacter beigongshangensis]|uniref:START domain-containing protein n=1 Tax=Pontibacter beigongshangensis TaxID=2574733 RepID=UPI0016509AD1|nr:START domain-containing protein [Pontibacter beigongshangensis]
MYPINYIWPVIGKARHILSLLFLLAVTPALLAQDGWDLKKDENGIKVYTRRLTDDKLKEIKVVTEMPGTPAQLVAVILDVANHKEWVYGLKETRLLKKVNDHTIIYYNVADLPWPVSNRDMVLQLTVSKDQNTQHVLISSKSLQDYMPPQKGKVRVPYSTASWKIVPLTKNTILAEYIFSVNPGGSLPAWVVNTVVTSGPLHSFTELRKIMTRQQ